MELALVEIGFQRANPYSGYHLLETVLRSIHYGVAGDGIGLV